jgi:hypothetical protein
MTNEKMNKSHQQKKLRRWQNEQAFIFDHNFQNCLAEVEREKWEMAISFAGGSIADVAMDCGLSGIPKGAKVLWGKSAQGALDVYRRWKNSKKNNSRK